MSTLSRLRISGVRSFDPDEEQDIKFSTPVTLFLGQNGCGKTSIIEAVKYAITGDLPSGTKNGQGFIHDPEMNQKAESRAQVKLKIHDIKGEAVTVQKISKVTQTLNGLKFTNISNAITRGTENISNRCIDVHNEVCRSMGVSKAILNNVIFCHQEDSYWPLEEPKKLKERFDAIFDSIKYTKCIEKILKSKKQRTDQLKILIHEVNFKKTNKIQMEKKKDQLREKEDRKTEMENKIKEMSEALTPLEEKLEDVYKLEREIRSVEADAERLKNQIDTNQEQQTDILSSINELDCSDEELQSKILSFQSDTEKTQNDIKQLEKDKIDIERKESNTRQLVTKEQVQLGKLQEEDKQNKIRMKQQQMLINTIQTEYDIDIPSNTHISEKIDIFETKLQEIEDQILNFEMTSEENEKQLQDDIDRFRTNYVQLKQEVDSKTKQLSELKLEKNEATKKLNELNTYDDQLSSIETRLVRAEEALKRLETQVNTNELKEEIENEKTKYENLEVQLRKVEKEIQILQNYSSIQTELDLQNENLLKKQKDMKSLYYKHENDFETIFNNDIPESNLKQSIDKYAKDQMKIVNEINTKITNKEKIVHKLEASLCVQKEKLKQMKHDYVKDKATVDEVFQGETFETAEADINNTIDDLQTQKGEFTNSIQMYTKFIQSFKKEKACCPVCMRDVQEKIESNKIIAEIEKKIKDFPNLAKQTEAKLTKELTKQTRILELKPMYYKIQQIESTDLPNLKKVISDLQNDFDQQSEELEGLKNNITKPKKNQELANSLISDAAFIDQYNIEIKKLQNEISTLKSRMPTMESTRNIQDAYFEQENLNSSSKEARQKLDSLTEKLTKHTERLQQIRDQRNELKTKELSIKQGLQGKDQLEVKKKEIEMKISDLIKNLEQVRNNIEPMKIKLDKAIKTKEDTKKIEKNKREELGGLFRGFEKILKEIKTLNDAIVNTDKKNIQDDIEKILNSIEKYNKELELYTSRKNSIMKQIEGLKDQIVNKKSYYRELLDNKKLREKRVALTALLAEYKELEKKIGDQDIKKLKHVKQQLEKKISDYNIELSQIQGKKSELEQAIKEAKKELSEPIYANAARDYKHKFLEYKILQLAIKDIENFVKALDWAMVQYHKNQMIVINETIRDLWRSIYRGNDIDYIEIKTEMETGTNDKKRVYQYRLVQVKNDVELEMRGRCSAGQKVLASLIIRIALSDTFSIRCGILALDEPTTNLDKENIGSLCDALCELINNRKEQESFQLLIITHDQEFLEKLSRSVYIENYIQVSRNEQGKSIVTTKPVTF